MIGVPERVGSSEGGGGGASMLPALKMKEFQLHVAVGSGLTSIFHFRRKRLIIFGRMR